jgi:maltose phosphorylase
LKKQASAWAAIWDRADVALEGDPAAQQALRFGIFQLYQSFDGQQAKSSLLPGGFSGERKQGNIQWDTELMALPFFLATADHPTAKNLLLYRCQQLPLAIQHAEKQGYGKGAALFPASTQNGYESHPDWEIALGGIHRNAAVVFAIQDYLEWTDDMDFLLGQGLPVLVAVARFWAQRVHWSEPKKAYVLLGTVGPNEYEANVNNNWYTNYMAAWCLQKTLESLQRAAGHDPEKYAATLKALQFDPEKECKHWKEIAAKLYLPLDKTTGVFLQQEAYLDKVQETAAVVPPSERPLRKYWPWDQLLRSCFVQQPDTLLGLYLLPNHFTEAELKCNFDFYAPKTLHENSFSACLHAVLACRLGQYGLAWDYFTAAQSYGLAAPVASMAEGLHTLHGIGNWLALLKGFGGLSTDRGQLAFAPSLPPGCTAFSFKIQWRGQLLEVKANVQGTTLVNHSDQVLDLVLYGEKCSLAGKQEKTFQLQS